MIRGQPTPPAAKPPLNKEDFYRRIVEQVDRLPPMPETLFQLRAIAARPSTTFRDLVPLIEKDAALSADLLHIVNSAAYGIGRRVDNIGEAVRYIGMDHLVEYVAVSFSHRIINQVFAKLGNLHEYFQHAQQVSRAAHILARLAGASHHDQEICKLGGLLHNIGRLVIILISEPRGGALMRIRWNTDQRELVRAESDLYGINHCQVGVLICQKWRFPNTLLTAIERHHCPVMQDEVHACGAFIFLGELLVIPELPLEVLATALPEYAWERIRVTPEILAAARAQFVAAPPDSGSAAGAAPAPAAPPAPRP